MNSLKFIEKEIKFLEDMINMDLALIEDEEDLKEIAKKQERLKHLQQIKTELEAWEEIKKYLVLNEGCIYEDSYYEYLTLQNDCIDETESEEQGVSLEIIKKALEVEE